MPEWWWYLRVVLILIGYFHSPSRTKDHVRSWTQKVISISAGEYFFSVFTNSQYCHHTKGLNNDQFFLPNGVTPANQFDDYNKLGSCSALFIVSYHLQYTLEFGHSLACPESQIFFSLSFIWQSTSHLVASGIHWSPLVSFRGVPRTSVALNVRQWYAQLCKWFDNISIDLSPEDRSAVDASMKKDLLATEPHKVMKLNPEKANACISAAYTFVLSTRYWTQILILLIFTYLEILNDLAWPESGSGKVFATAGSEVSDFFCISGLGWCQESSWNIGWSCCVSELLPDFCFATCLGFLLRVIFS